MALATPIQVQRWADERTRVRAEQIRALVLALESDVAQIDDIYAALNVATPEWQDSRTDGPPSLLTPSDVLGMHSFAVAALTALKGHDQYPVVLSACVRPVQI